MHRKITALAVSTIVVLGGGLALYAQSSMQHAKFFTFLDAFGQEINPPHVIKASSVKLSRDDEGISITAKTNGLPPGAYTNWWVILNPGATDPVVLWATGGIVGRDGVGHFSARLNEGETRPEEKVFLGLDGTLQDAQQAGILYVIKYHGPAVSEIIDKQTGTSFGGCTAAGTELPNDDEDPLFFCYDPQITPLLSAAN
jgi:hypothetical protein